MYRLDVTLDQLPLSLNVALRSHWTKQRKQHADIADLIALEINSQLPDAPLQKARITITAHTWKFRDYDGFVGSLKPVVDALVTLGVLIDDSYDVTGPWNCKQVKRPKKDGYLLEISVIQEV